MNKMSSLRVLFCLMLALAMVFSISSAAFAEAAPVDEAAEFDTQLIGQWYRYDIQNDGKYDSDVIDFLRYLEFILPDGTFSYNELFALANASGVDQLTASAADGVTDLGQKLVDYVLAYGEAFGIDSSLLEEADKLSDIEITYEKFDFDPDSVEWVYISDSLKDAYRTASSDGLRLHVTGKYQQDPLTTKTIDVTYSYYEELLDDVFFEPFLCGDWTDQNGNAWHFGFVLNESGTADFAFTMTTSDGTEYVGTDMYADNNLDADGGAVYEMSFEFEDFSSPYYEIINATDDSITLQAEDDELILTRN